MAKAAQAQQNDDVFGERAYDPSQFGDDKDGLLDRAIAATPQPQSMPFVTRQKVDVPRDIRVATETLMKEAAIAGEAFYYSWEVYNKKEKRNDIVEGPSVDLCLAAARCWGNCNIDVLPLQYDSESWIITTRFIDLETGFNVSRPFRQSKHSTVFGNMDAERKDDTRFQIGVSKSQRNVIKRALPPWLINQAMIEAKKGVRNGLEKAMKTHGVAVVVERAIAALKSVGVPSEAVCRKFCVTKTMDLTLDHLVRIKGDLAAIEAGQEFKEALYPMEPADGDQSGLRGKNAEDALGPKDSEADASPGANAPTKANASQQKPPSPKRAAPPKKAAKPPAKEEEVAAPEPASEQDSDEELPPHDDQGEVFGDTEDETAEAPAADGEEVDAGEESKDAEVGESEADDAAEADGSDHEPEADTAKSPSDVPPGSGGGRGVSAQLQEVYDALGKATLRKDVNEILMNLGSEEDWASKEELDLAMDACQQKYEIIKRRAQESLARK